MSQKLHYMEHERHGIMPVYNEQQFELDKKNGWKMLSFEDFDKKMVERRAKIMGKKAPAPKQEEPITAHEMRADLEAMTYKELQDMCVDYGLDKIGKKDALIDRLMEHVGG